MKSDICVLGKRGTWKWNSKSIKTNRKQCADNVWLLQVLNINSGWNKQNAAVEVALRCVFIVTLTIVCVCVSFWLICSWRWLTQTHKHTNTQLHTRTYLSILWCPWPWGSCTWWRSVWVCRRSAGSRVRTWSLQGRHFPARTHTREENVTFIFSTLPLHSHVPLEESFFLKVFLGYRRYFVRCRVWTRETNMKSINRCLGSNPHEITGNERMWVQIRNLMQMNVTFPFGCLASIRTFCNRPFSIIYRSLYVFWYLFNLTDS